MTSLKPLLSAVAFGAVLSAVSPANAALITTWSFEVTNTWVRDLTTFDDDPGVHGFHDNRGKLLNNTDPADSVPGASGTYNIISWGPEQQTIRSFLAADARFDQAYLETNGDAARGASFYHNNQVLTEGNTKSLLSTKLETTVKITSVSPVTGLEYPLFLEFDINFDETDNTVSRLRNCDGYNRWSAGIDPSTLVESMRCPDRFTLNTSDLSITQQIDDYLYTFKIGFETGSNVLNVTEFEGLTEIWTRESRMSTVTSWISVTAERVPEPASIGLLGLGLAAAGAGLRRRRK